MSDRDIIAAHGFYEHDFGGGFCYCGVTWPDEEWLDHRQQHAAHVVDMLRQARTITTIDQLDALPVGTVVRDHEADIMVYGPTGEGESAWWYDGDPYRANEVDLPALVLWRPEDGDQ